MSLHDPEVFGVTESSLTIGFRADDATQSEVLLDGEVRAAGGGSGRPDACTSPRSAARR